MNELEDLEIEFKLDVYDKFPPTFVLEAERALGDALRYRELRAKQKWQEVVYVGGAKYGLNCRKIGNNIRVSRIVKLRKKAIRKSDKR